MQTTFTEANLEQAFIEVLQDLGYEYVFGPDLACDGQYAERADYKDVILENRLREELLRINKGFPKEAIDDAFRQFTVSNSPSLVDNNRSFHDLLVKGADVTFRKDGEDRTKKVYAIDFDNINNNDFLVVNQFTVVGKEERRPDVVLFINGLPLVVMELKSASDENVGIEEAYNQIQTYKNDISRLFEYNVLSILSDGIKAKVGTFTANMERYMNWRSVDGETVEPLYIPQYETMLKGMLSKQRFLDVLTGYVMFQDSTVDELDENGDKIGTKKQTVKILAGYHQYFAVKKAVKCTQQATAEVGDRRIGVVWHTQGSGKSFSMVFYTGQLVKQMDNPTIVVITDRNDLDQQLFTTFSNSQDILGQTPKQANVRKKKLSSSVDENGLFDLLNDRKSGGIIFTTIQKFAPEEGEMPVLSDRRNIIIMADEAHRSQYGLEAKTNINTGSVKYGYAKHLRDALPNASFIGFTGTPIEFDDKSTTQLFGNYIDVYDLSRAVEDKATVKIYYENRIIKLDMPDNVIDEIDEEFEEITDGLDNIDRERNKSKWSKLEAVVGSPNRVKRLANDIVNHYETKSKVVDGKAMIVCMSRKICVGLYDEIIALQPDWHSDDLEKGKIKIVMTGSAADNECMQKHVGGKVRRDTLAKRMKNNKDELKIVIVRDMWLTGFDVPSMHTMYIDKPMKGHNLMQAIARVNRVFKDKNGGVVVDYIGILESLKRALNQYTESDRQTAGIDTSQAVGIMLEKLDILDSMFYEIDFEGFFNDKQSERLKSIAVGMNFVLSLSEKEQKEFKQISTELGKAHGLCAATEEGKNVALEVSYYKAVKASLVKLDNKGKKILSKREMEKRVSQLLEKSIVSEEAIDVFDVMGLKKPDISILSEEFLEEVKAQPMKNLAVEMLKKLLLGEVRSAERTNLVKAQMFSEKLKKSLNKYTNGAISNAEVLEELIKMAREIRTMHEDEQKLGLSKDEIAFYYALSKEDTVKEVMSDEILKDIAIDLADAIRRNTTIDFSIRKQAQALMRKTIRRLLKRHGYPPEEAKHAIDLVMQQVMLMCESA
jgi:type I restriction enzyme, R subunit